MSSPIYVAIDIYNRVLSGFNGSVAQLPNLYLYDQQTFQVQLVTPPSALVPPNNVYVKADYTGYTMDIAIGAIPTGAGGAYASLIHGLAWDGQNKQFLGVLDLSQALVLDLLESPNIPNASVWLEFSIWQTGQTAFRWGTPVNLYSVLDTGSVANPPPAGPTYPTTADARAGFLSKGPTKTDSKIWLSGDGTKAVLQYLDNNGKMQYDPINPAPNANY